MKPVLAILALSLVLPACGSDDDPKFGADAAIDAPQPDAPPQVTCDDKIEKTVNTAAALATQMVFVAANPMNPDSVDQTLAGGLLDQSMTPDAAQVHFLHQGIFAGGSILLGPHSLDNNPDLFSLLFVNVEFDSMGQPVGDGGVYFAVSGNAVVTDFEAMPSPTAKLNVTLQNALYLEIDRATSQQHPDMCETTLTDLVIAATP